MKSKKYSAKNVTVLNLNYRALADGDVIPPESKIVFRNPVPVIFNNEWDKLVGFAYLMRVGNKITADFSVSSDLPDCDEAMNLIKQMYPSVSGRVVTRVGNSVFKLQIKGISVYFSPNHDEYIEQLGARVKRIRNSE